MKLLPYILQNWVRSLTLGALSALVISTPVKAGEKIYFTYGPLSWSVSVDSLATFAKDGTIDKELEFYLSRATPEQQTEFRKALRKRVDINPVRLYRFFNTEIGEDILTRIGKGVTIQGGRNGKYGLRAAIVQAAFDSQEGLTLLNVLRKFPTNMQLQGELILGGAKTIGKFSKATKAYTETMAKLSAQEAAAETPVSFAQIPDLRRPGELGFQKETFTLTDSNRAGRTFYVILYKPEKWRTGKTPVVVLSHGLASKPEDFEALAKHLASYGFVVALPQHPGSDTKWAQDFLKGYHGEVFDSNEFINRPKDISYLIDELERRNQSQFGGRLDLENVGVAGHSFGGYTALAVAGAEIEFDFLQQECERLYGGLNTSLLLQCRALSLPRQTYKFRDPRVKAVLGGNPVNSAIFGQKGLEQIQIPLMFVSGNLDPATPGVFEQLRSFMWLTTPNKYLALAEGQAHVDFSKLDPGIASALESVTHYTLPSPDLLHSYRDAMFLAFFEVYIANNAQFRPYLQSSYAAYLSQNERFKLFLISSDSEPGMKQAIEDFRAKEGPILPKKEL